MTTPIRAEDARLEAARTAFRTLLLHVVSEPQDDRLLRSAADLAARLDATLFGVGAEMVDPALLTSGYAAAADVMPELKALVQDSLKRAEVHFTKAAGEARRSWLATEDQPIRALATASSGADLVLASAHRPAGSGAYRACEAAELVLKCGRPVLVVPSRGGKLAAEAVVIAWKDTREARRALADSLPFLKSASDVVLVEVRHADAVAAAEARLAAVSQGLRAHGVQVRSKVTVGNGDCAYEHVELTAQGCGADLIVAGAYGHSRFGEWVFGGVTRDLLRDPQRFLMLSH